MLTDLYFRRPPAGWPPGSPCAAVAVIAFPALARSEAACAGRAGRVTREHRRLGLQVLQCRRSEQQHRGRSRPVTPSASATPPARAVHDVQFDAGSTPSSCVQTQPAPIDGLPVPPVPQYTQGPGWTGSNARSTPPGTYTFFSRQAAPARKCHADDRAHDLIVDPATATPTPTAPPRLLLRRRRRPRRPHHRPRRRQAPPSASVEAARLLLPGRGAARPRPTAASRSIPPAGLVESAHPSGSSTSQRRLRRRAKPAVVRADDRARRSRRRRRCRSSRCRPAGAGSARSTRPARTRSCAPRTRRR